MDTRKNIFISYSHQDKIWLDKLNIFLKPLVRSTKIDVWDDTKIGPGKNWNEEITNALKNANVAILLVSSNFLASDFIIDEELPKILKKASKEGLIILWIPLGHCLYIETELANYQAAHNPSKPLDCIPPHEQNQILVEICQKIKKILAFDSKVSEIEELEIRNIEIAPDDWDTNHNSFFGKIRKIF